MKKGNCKVALTMYELLCIGMNMSIIEGLFNGEISVHEDLCPPPADSSRVVELSEDLRKNLSEDLIEKFEEYGDEKDKATSLLAQQSFVEGFKLGAKIILEINN